MRAPKPHVAFRRRTKRQSAGWPHLAAPPAPKTVRLFLGQRACPRRAYAARTPRSATRSNAAAGQNPETSLPLRAFVAAADSTACRPARFRRRRVPAVPPPCSTTWICRCPTHPKPPSGSLHPRENQCRPPRFCPQTACPAAESPTFCRSHCQKRALYSGLK